MQNILKRKGGHEVGELSILENSERRSKNPGRCLNRSMVTDVWSDNSKVIIEFGRVYQWKRFGLLWSYMSWNKKSRREVGTLSQQRTCLPMTIDGRWRALAWYPYNRWGSLTVFPATEEDWKRPSTTIGIPGLTKLAVNLPALLFSQVRRCWVRFLRIHCSAGPLFCKVPIKLLPNDSPWLTRRAWVYLPNCSGKTLDNWRDWVKAIYEYPTPVFWYEYLTPVYHGWKRKRGINRWWNNGLESEEEKFSGWSITENGQDWFL